MKGLRWVVLLVLALSACGSGAVPTATTAPTAPAASVAPATAAATATRASGGMGTGTTPVTGTPSGGATPVASGPLKKLTIGLGYIPDIQFAPFYVAKE